MLEIETAIRESGADWIAGVDEAGRGPLAGPVVAAAVIFRPGDFHDRVRDSKKIRPCERDSLYDWIRGNAACVGVGIVGPERIDETNILQATHAAMREALASLSPEPRHIIVDGRPIPRASTPQTAVIRGDARCFSVAAASIIAKVTRDRLMAEYDRSYPQYGFARHKGYGTRLHVDAIRSHGLCPIHRRTFRIPEW
ncbi:ribonuclease HII [bacterium]|nr:ribonuclease HII [bacterium]